MKYLPWTLLVLSGAVPSSATGQAARPTRLGDSTVVPAIAHRSQVAYDSTGGRWGGFVLTKKNLTGLAGAYGTDIRVAYLHGAPARLVLEQWTPEGKYGAEYYLSDGEPYLVFATLERYQEATGDPWHNFKGLGGWEQRIYLVGGDIRYVETQGTSAPTPSTEGVRAVVGRLLNALRARSRP